MAWRVCWTPSVIDTLQYRGILYTIVPLLVNITCNNLQSIIELTTTCFAQVKKPDSMHICRDYVNINTILIVFSLCCVLLIKFRFLWKLSISVKVRLNKPHFCCRQVRRNQSHVKDRNRSNQSQWKALRLPLSCYQQESSLQLFCL